MSRSIHGGDIYSNTVKYDFSVNTNLLGTPDAVKDVLRASICNVDIYPEYDSDTLKDKLADIWNIDSNQIVITNGASEGFLALCHSNRYSVGGVIVPSFYGYEYALNSIDAQINRIAENDFPQAISKLKNGVLFLANPNNPTGKNTSKEDLIRIIQMAKQNDIDVILDECFLPLSKAYQDSFIYELANCPVEYSNLTVVRSFTKTFAIPGIRLGYIVTASAERTDKIRKNISEWNVSSIGQKAGVACLECLKDLDMARTQMSVERLFLEENFDRLKIEYLKSDTNFILFKSYKDLKNRLLKHGILIRDCSNYYGLDSGYFRIAVKNRNDNLILISALEKELKA